MRRAQCRRPAVAQIGKIGLAWLDAVAELGVEGIAFSDWSYYLLLDFSSTIQKSYYIYTTYIEYRGLRPFAFRVGAYAPPEGIEEATGSADLIFPERPAVADVSRNVAGAPSRESATLFLQTPRVLAALSYTGGKVGDVPSRQQQGMVGRLAFLGYRDADLAILFDADASYVLKPARSSGSSIASVRLSTQPEVTVGDYRLLDTGRIAASHLAESHVEAAVDWRSLYAQGGYFHYWVTRPDPLPDAAFEGWYATIAWTLTGEKRAYDAYSASFREPRPDAPADSGGWGAWELAMRYSALDLNDARGFRPIRGGRQSVVSMEANWYLTAHVRLELDEEFFTVRRSGSGGGVSPLSSSATILRSQISF